VAKVTKVMETESWDKTQKCFVFFLHLFSISRENLHGI
jgi:hypothetical protein